MPLPKTKIMCYNIYINKRGGIMAEKKTNGTYRVIYDSVAKKWNIKKDGAERIIDSRKTKEEALERVKVLSKNQNSNFVTYKKDGKFQKKK